MKKSVRIWAVILLGVLLCSFSACTQKQEDVAVFTLKGPTGMGMVQLMQAAEEGKAKENYAFTICGAPTEIVAAIASGEADIAACPVNVAATLYNKTGGNVEALAVNTMGVLYLLDKTGEVNSIAGLRGKTVYTSGQGSTPQYIVEKLLTENGLDPQKDTELVYLSEHSEVVAQAVAGKADIVILPEPNVTALQAKAEDFRVALDLTEEWGKVIDFDLTQGCVIVRKEYLQAHPQAVKSFLQEYAASVDYVCTQPEDAAKLIEKYEIVASAAMAQKALPRCNIVYKAAEEMQQLVQGNLQVLFEANPAAVGGAMPGEDFYYTEK